MTTTIMEIYWIYLLKKPVITMIYFILSFHIKIINFFKFIYYFHVIEKRNSSITTRQTSTRHTQNFEDEDELDTEHTTWINRLSHAK